VVPVVDLSRRGARFAGEFADVAERIAKRGSYLLGDELESFERALAAWIGADHAAGVASGASALQLALTAAGVEPGDEVLVPAFTAVPTASAVIAAGAVPVAVDVDPETACLTPESIGCAMTTRTRAVVVVHLYGFPAELPATRDGVALIEDAAQAMGALGRPDLSSAAAYSFYPTKNLGGIGDGGAVVTNEAALDARVRLLRTHGATGQYVHEAISQNFRMSEIEAAWLRLGLRALRADVNARRGIAARYRRAAPHLRWQRDHARHAYHLCVFRASARHAVRERLAEAGVGTAVHYPLALTQQPAYRTLFPTSCPSAEAWAAECVSVPCFPELTEDEIERVATALAELPPER
jgi:dTDP-3-amino-3,4,6-trideoxy-alpha-D-glucose transaminase